MNTVAKLKSIGKFMMTCGTSVRSRSNQPSKAVDWVRLFDDVGFFYLKGNAVSSDFS